MYVLELYRPTYICRDFDEIPDLNLVYQQHKHWLIIDFHQTLFWIRQQVIDPVRLTILKRWLENGTFSGAAILCNAVIPGRWSKSLEELSNILDQTGARIFPVELIMPWQLKPRPYGFLHAMKLLGAKPEETVVIGDQLFTDILGGNRLGMTTVLVKPLGRDPWWNAIRRRRQKEQRMLAQLGLARHLEAEYGSN